MTKVNLKNRHLIGIKNKTRSESGFCSLAADRTGLEPATSAVTGRHSNQLNYRSVSSLGVQI